MALIVAAVIAVALLLTDRRETFRAEASGAARGAADSVMAPVGDVLSAPGRWTETAAAAFARAKALLRSRSTRRQAANAPTKQSPAPVLSITGTLCPAISIMPSGPRATSPEPPRVVMTT